MARDTTMPFADFEKLSRDMYQNWEKAMTSWWDQVLDDPNVLGAVGKNLEAGVRARGAYQRSVDETLERMHLPTRSDLTRLAKISSMLEDRLLSMEDTLLELGDKLASVERETVKARIEAGETRLELRERLASLEARLAALEARAEASAEPAAKRSTRSRKRPAAKKAGAKTDGGA